MDETVFYFSAAFIMLLILMGFYFLKDRSQIGMLMLFMAGAVGMIITTTVNTDGGLFALETACSNACTLTNIAPTWPIDYLPLFLTILAWGSGIIKAVGNR